MEVGGGWHETVESGGAGAESREVFDRDGPVSADEREGWWPVDIWCAEVL